MKLKPKTPLASNIDHTKESISEDTLLDNELQLAKWQAEVHNRMRDNMGADYVLAKLSEKQKELITELVSDAYLVKKQMTRIKENSRRWVWDKKKKVWEELEWSKLKQQKMQKIIDATFDSIMIRPNSTSILERNKDRNAMLGHLGNYRRRSEEEEPSGETTNNGLKLKEKTLNVLRPESDGEEIR